jgi:hypothetical protein
MNITNEFILAPSGTRYYYKVFNVNWVKIGWITYKTDNPNTDYHRVFTMCLKN